MTIKIAMYKGTRTGLPGLYNRAVRVWTLGPYSHCEMIAGDHGDGTTICWGASWPDGGVRQKTMWLDPAKWDLMDVAGDLVGAVYWFEKHNGEGYDIRGNFGLVLRPLGHSQSKWFCSEAILAAMGFVEPWRYCPNAMSAIFGSPSTKPLTDEAFVFSADLYHKNLQNVLNKS